MKERITTKKLRTFSTLLNCTMCNRIFACLNKDYYNAGTYGWNYDSITVYYKGRYYSMINGYRPPKCWRLDVAIAFKLNDAMDAGQITPKEALLAIIDEYLKEKN